MKKNYFIISSIVLISILSIVIYKFYKIDNDQQNITFRVDTEQDIQVRNNESMLSKSLTNMMNLPSEEKPKNYENSDSKGLSNNVEHNKLK